MEIRESLRKLPKLVAIATDLLESNQHGHFRKLWGAIRFVAIQSCRMTVQQLGQPSGSRTRETGDQSLRIDEVRWRHEFSITQEILQSAMSSVW